MQGVGILAGCRAIDDRTESTAADAGPDIVLCIELVVGVTAEECIDIGGCKFDFCNSTHSFAFKTEVAGQHRKPCDIQVDAAPEFGAAGSDCDIVVDVVGAKVQCDVFCEGIAAGNQAAGEYY